jgi:hypothetical protein
VAGLGRWMCHLDVGLTYASKGHVDLLQCAVMTSIWLVPLQDAVAAVHPPDSSMGSQVCSLTLEATYSCVCDDTVLEVSGCCRFLSRARWLKLTQDVLRDTDWGVDATYDLNCCRSCSASPPAVPVVAAKGACKIAWASVEH